MGPRSPFGPAEPMQGPPPPLPPDARAAAQAVVATGLLEPLTPPPPDPHVDPPPPLDPPADPPPPPAARAPSCLTPPLAPRHQIRQRIHHPRRIRLQIHHHRLRIRRHRLVHREGEGGGSGCEVEREATQVEESRLRLVRERGRQAAGERKGCDAGGTIWFLGGSPPSECPLSACPSSPWVAPARASLTRVNQLREVGTGGHMLASCHRVQQMAKLVGAPRLSVSVWPHSSLPDPSPGHRLPVSSAARRLASLLLPHRRSNGDGHHGLPIIPYPDPFGATTAPAPSPSTSGDSSARLLRAQPRHGRRGRGVSVSTPAAWRRPFVFTPRAVSDSKSSQTCLDLTPARYAPTSCAGNAASLLVRLAVSRLPSDP
ncbi:hypothetical protein HU200_047678 [Digitaria exilis]|uniref:Uncharacterized protein n=1 Tax=Digitaria exilis TaxID=1010633 RepID=A0A835E8D7_9POAL|nr:hypothetical protein HU200_047678 [Digitaria exilis]